jgi:hypothetical protein
LTGVARRCRAVGLQSKFAAQRISEHVERNDERRQQNGNRWNPLKCHQASQQKAHSSDEDQQMPQPKAKKR